MVKILQENRLITQSRCIIAPFLFANFSPRPPYIYLAKIIRHYQLFYFMRVTCAVRRRSSIFQGVYNKTALHGFGIIFFVSAKQQVARALCNV
jgi:hypothetical protein